MDHAYIQKFRDSQVKKLPTSFGVYTLIDASGTVVYVGQTTDSFRNRVRRHTTSARSDIIANRILDVSEIAYVDTYAVADRDQVSFLETFLIHHFNDLSPIVNAKIPPKPLKSLDFTVPTPSRIQILPDDAIKHRLNLTYRISRQLKSQSELFDFIVAVKDNNELRRNLLVSQSILNNLVKEFLGK